MNYKKPPSGWCLSASYLAKAAGHCDKRMETGCVTLIVSILCSYFLFKTSLNYDVLVSES